MISVVAVAQGPKDLFRLFGDVAEIESLATSLRTTDEDDYEFHIQYTDRGFEDGPYTQEERNAEVSKLESLIASLRTDDYLQSLIAKLPKKKNGTFTKNRTLTLFRANTNSHLAVEWFGWFAQDVVVKAVNDYEAVISVERRCEKWA